MSLLLTILKLLALFAAGLFLTVRVLPFLFKSGGRLLGFKMKLTPITRKRIERFKRIKRGYYSFILIVTLFVTSIFLELCVNSKPLAISYDGRTAYPAVADWVDHMVFFKKISTYYKASDFGFANDGNLDFKTFAQHCQNPKALTESLAEDKAKVEKKKKRFQKRYKVPPGPEASKSKKEAYEMRLRSLKKGEERIKELEDKANVFRDGRAWCLMPFYPYSPSDLRHEFKKNPPNSPSINLGIPLGTDTSGRDVLPLLAYGFRLSMGFALLIAAIGYAIGIVVGAFQGYYGGWIDIISQRFVEIWSSIPFLFTIMIIASMVTPSFLLLIALMVVLRSWLGITFYIRGEFYREKSKDYVQAAIGAGVSDWKIIIGHILPNALIPVVTFAPFGIVAYISALVSLDFLGFGLPPGTPSWGALLKQGLDNVKFYPHLTIIPTIALAATLYTVVMIGEAVREAFDPKVFSRLR